MTDAQGTPKGPAGAAAKKRGNRDVVREVAAVVILALLFGFVLDNSQSVKVGFIFFSANVALIWVLVVTAVLGACLDRLLVWRLRKGRQAAKKARTSSTGR
ncbi:MAG: hypothetical protein ACLQOZ_08935 [Acidimicrobiales bacterium]